MSLDCGINFRSTSGYVTDGAGQTYCLGSTDTYPQTRGGATFGWTGSPLPGFARDRNAGNDPRIAGNNEQTNDGTQSHFQLDLPASGSYTLHLALGDAAYSKGYNYVRVTDGNGGSTLLTVDNSAGTASQHFADATNTVYTNNVSTGWPALETGVAVTFTGTTLWLILGTPGAQTAQSCLAHLRVVQAGGATGSLFRPADLSGIGSGGPFFSNPLGRAPGGAWPGRRHRRKRFVELGVRP